MSELLTITPRAIERIRGLVADRPSATAGVRLDVIGGARSGFAYDLFFDARDAADCVVETSGICFLVRPDCVPYVEGTIIDWVESANGAGFQIRNPNEPPR